MLSSLFPRESSQRKLLTDLAFPVPAHLARRFVRLEAEGARRLEASLERDYFCDFPAGYLQTDVGRDDLRAHLTARRDLVRQRVVPWLDSLRPLEGARILEIGCGTGSSTVALAEQQANVVGIELVERHLEVTRVRCAEYGVGAELFCANATEVSRLFAGRSFDMVLFYACLEHMTVAERLDAIARAWELLRPGALLCVADTPNRLWYYDDHTSLLPFFMWLPDELAYRYAKFSPRPLFRDAVTGESPVDMTGFQRWGRGVSFHDFEVALDLPMARLDVQESLRMFGERRNPALWLARLATGQSRFTRFLQSRLPGLHQAFCEPELALAIRKP